MIESNLRNTLAGLDIVVNPALDDVPRMQVSASFAALMPPEFVADLNAWMLERFGTHSPMYRLPGNRIVMGVKAHAQLKTLVTL
ncbi:hypothetical protein [Paraburkholderia tropica]|uniref:hypothetical protein n=1 Tax=Paraburkholderia tropica TaxID=92647 RepID=UPI0016112A78|nr:hypothetical protein [Paraburkholderia tropica]MBB2981773.1 hypothetical protein [Paraburkholderia tropica]